VNEESLEFKLPRLRRRSSSADTPPHLEHLVICPVVQAYSWMQHFSVIIFPYSPILTTVDYMKNIGTPYKAWEKPTKKYMHIWATLIPTEVLSHNNK